MGVEEMRRLAALVTETMSHIGDEKVTRWVMDVVAEMCRRFPMPGYE
jgi:glycine/serine hydroxymethyltransferase